MAKRRGGVQDSPSCAGARAPRGAVTRQGVVLTDLQSLLDCQYNFSLSLSLFSLALNLREVRNPSFSLCVRGHSEAHFRLIQETFQLFPLVVLEQQLQGADLQPYAPSHGMPWAV